ncbi:MAG: hypothetical protein ACYDDF_00045 [Thermoplasmatota archaeon]
MRSDAVRNGASFLLEGRHGPVSTQTTVAAREPSNDGPEAETTSLRLLFRGETEPYPRIVDGATTRAVFGDFRGRGFAAEASLWMAPAFQTDAALFVTAMALVILKERPARFRTR